MLYHILRRFLFTLPPERAHELTLRALKIADQMGVLDIYRMTLPESKGVVLWGKRFPSRIGLSAGLDRTGLCTEAWMKLGLGFIELGTVTPRPQSGNPQPRLFRLPKAEALINRMGFHNSGCSALVEELERLKKPRRGIVGISIVKNRETPLDMAYQDYQSALNIVAPQADYVALNISSPNTVGLRKLQDSEYLVSLLNQIKTTQKEIHETTGRYVPLLVKLSPDLSAVALQESVDQIVHSGMDGIIVTNTTLSREGVQGIPHAHETGGLSGKPLFAQSCAVLASVRHWVGPDFPLIAVGGIMTASDARTMMGLGANLMQLYTGLIYHGPGLIRDILREIRGDLS